MGQGDTLTAIARRFDVSVTDIAAANHLGNLNQLAPGQVLVIPRAKPVRFVITPAQGTAGNAFTFRLTGAKPDELVVFEIVRPDGSKFVGQPHVAQPDGSVSANYLTGASEQLGLYKVLAGGNQGTVAHTDFQVSPAPTSSTSR